MQWSTGVDITVLVSVGFVLWLIRNRRSRNAIPLPPGPRPLPLIGNALDMPTSKVWLRYTEWREQYGSLVYVPVFGQSIMILNSLQAALDLFEKRSSNYSSRINTAMLDLSDWPSWDFGFQKYGAGWRLGRKLFHLGFHPTRAARYHGIQESSMHAMLKKLLNQPEDFLSHIRVFAAGTILKITYGHEIAEKDDQFVVEATAAMEIFEKLTRPGTYLVDIFPMLRYIPTWMPGATFHQIAKKTKDLGEVMINNPFNNLRRQMANGEAAPCFALDLLTNPDESISGDKVAIRDAAGFAFGAGFDTTVSSLSFFVALMVNNPAVQKKAQRELDEVIGPNRVPTMEDRRSLPYVEALLKEVMRFSPALPLGVPHASVSEDVYHGYRIPADTMIIPNTWGILHDPDLYHDPFTFNPERFLGPNPECDPKIAGVFGFGRRICAGRYMADASLYLAISNTLAVFNITHAVDEAGRPIEVSVVEGEGMISHPLPFRCKIYPRSDEAVDLIRQL